MTKKRGAELVVIEAGSLEEARAIAGKMFPNYKLVADRCVMCGGNNPCNNPLCLVSSKVAKTDGSSLS